MNLPPDRRNEIALRQSSSTNFEIVLSLLPHPWGGNFFAPSSRFSAEAERREREYNRFPRHLHHRPTLAPPFLPVLQLVCLIALATATLLAADPAGQISGRVTDPQGATVSHAQIKVSDQGNVDRVPNHFRRTRILLLPLDWHGRV